MANTNLRTYKIQPGDNFFLLAKRFGLSLTQVLQANSEVNPDKLEVGQVIRLPSSAAKSNPKSSGNPGSNSYGDSPTAGESFTGKNMDHIGVNIAGVDFELKRVIDNNVPHEVHILLPRTEVHTVTRNPDYTVSETQLMISNIDIIHSPRQ